MKFTINPIDPRDDGGTGHRWYAALDEDNGSPAFDGDGVTIEDAMAALIVQLGQWVEGHR